MASINDEYINCSTLAMEILKELRKYHLIHLSYGKNNFIENGRGFIFYHFSSRVNAQLFITDMSKELVIDLRKYCFGNINIKLWHKMLWEKIKIYDPKKEYIMCVGIDHENIRGEKITSIFPA